MYKYVSIAVTSVPVWSMVVLTRIVRRWKVTSEGFQETFITDWMIGRGQQLLQIISTFLFIHHQILGKYSQFGPTTTTIHTPSSHPTLIINPPQPTCYFRYKISSGWKYFISSARKNWVISSRKPRPYPWLWSTMSVSDCLNTSITKIEAKPLPVSEFSVKIKLDLSGYGLTYEIFATTNLLNIKFDGHNVVLTNLTHIRNVWNLYFKIEAVLFDGSKLTCYIFNVAVSSLHLTNKQTEYHQTSHWLQFTAA